MTTSKITKIVEVKPWTGNNGTVYYHSLEMDNGDKINIGKKKELQVGWELTYEITDASQEYNKARSVNPEFKQAPASTFQAPKAQTSNDTDKRILWQVCLKEAMAYNVAHGRIPSAADNLDPHASEIDLLAASVTALTSKLYQQSEEYLKEL